MSKYFPGRQDVTSFILSLHGGSARLSCNIAAKWETIVQDEVRCSGSGSYRETKRIGLKKSDRKALDSVIQSSIGIQGLASLGAEIKSHLESEIVWEEEKTEEQTFNFTAPDCGHYLALKYQLLRLYDLHYQDDRWLHKGSWTRTIVERTRQFSDGSKRTPFDEACGCSKQKTEDYDGVYYLDMGNIAMLVPFWQNQTDLLLDFYERDAKVEVPYEQGAFAASIPKEVLPESLLFLGEGESESYNGIFTLYSEPLISQNSTYFNSGLNP